MYRIYDVVRFDKNQVLYESGASVHVTSNSKLIETFFVVFFFLCFLNICDGSA